MNKSSISKRLRHTLSNDGQQDNPARVSNPGRVAIPPFFIAAVLLFWGWQTDMLLFAAGMALVVEAARVVSFRWELSVSDTLRIGEASLLIFVGTLVYRFLAESIMRGSFFPLKWLPISLLPLMIAQAYDASGQLDARGLIGIVRSKRQMAQFPEPMMMSISFPYCAICLMAAAAGNKETIGFYAGFLLISGWGLFTLRSRRYSPWLWGSLLIAVAASSFLGLYAIVALQRSLEESTFLIDWLRNLRQDVDPYESTTAIGRIGAVKLSNEVICRVRIADKPRDSLLLREASYPVYRSTKWFAPEAEFKPIQVEADDTTWKISSPQTPAERVTVAQYMVRGKSILKIPNGTFLIERLLVGDMLQNPFGAIKVQQGPGLISYDVTFNLDHSLDSPPNQADFALPEEEAAEFRALASELGLASVSPQEAVARASVFFQEHFTYSLDLQRQNNDVSPLTDFLRYSRSGHCEYFATATVLLLRAAGIPARYAVGYSTEELRPGRWTIVRGSDGHAWTLVYLNGAWRDIDTTPASWRSFQEQSESPFVWLSNLWARIRFALSALRWGERQGGNEPYLIGALVVLLLLLGWRLYKLRRRKSAAEQPVEAVEIAALRQGIDSAFYDIERRLQEAGFVRNEWETLSAWMTRILGQSAALPLETLAPLLDLHYRYRFDPAGISAEEMTRLRDAAQAWLAAHPSAELAVAIPTEKASD